MWGSETAIVELRPDVEATDFAAEVCYLGWGAQLIDKDKFGPDPQRIIQQHQEWNAGVEHTLKWSDFCRDDSTRSYFVAAPLRSVALVARTARGNGHAPTRRVRARVRDGISGRQSRGWHLGTLDLCSRRIGQADHPAGERWPQSTGDLGYARGSGLILSR